MWILVKLLYIRSIATFTFGAAAVHRVFRHPLPMPLPLTLHHDVVSCMCGMVAVHRTTLLTSRGPGGIRASGACPYTNSLGQDYSTVLWLVAGNRFSGMFVAATRGCEAGQWDTLQM